MLDSGILRSLITTNLDQERFGRKGWALLGFGDLFMIINLRSTLEYRFDFLNLENV